MFPDPEAFNPLRWVEPGYPTYQEPLTQYPNITNISQFGYGRRVCQGQTVADEDMLIGIGSIAWLFNIDRYPDDTSAVPTVPDVVTDPEKVELKTSISSEELNAGMQLDSPTKEDVILSRYTYPGGYPAADKEQARKETKSLALKHQKAEKIDPTLDFSTLLIAKPLPFKFLLRPRDTGRAEKVRNLYDEGVHNGDYKGNREFWGADQGKDQQFGWGKV
jgi:hypothetical protein